MLKHLSFFYKNMQIIHSYIQHIIRIAAIILSIMVVSSCNLSLWQEKNEDDKIKIESKEISNSVMLTIEDEGVGIIERDLDRVFEKGFTGENGRKFGKSTGIGLYLCKKLCNKLGLGLEIQSKVNVGTKISIIFPKAENLIET